MASSPYAGSDLYDLTRGITYIGMDLASTPLLPFAKLKTVASASKAIIKAEKIAHNSPTLLKTNLVTSKIFKSSKSSSHLKDTVKPIWTSNKKFTSVGNAYDHWLRHGKEFPDLHNAKQYVKKAHDLFRNPLALKRIRKSDGAVLRYNPSTNTFGSYLSTGTPKTFFKPGVSKSLDPKYATPLEYFYGQ